MTRDVVICVLGWTLEILSEGHVSEINITKLCDPKAQVKRITIQVGQVDKR